MRSETDKAKIEAFMAAIGKRVTRRIRELFARIEPQLIRYPAIAPASFRTAVQKFCDDNK